MTNEQLEVTLRVINRITTKFSFHEVEDIRQEAFIIASDIIPHWDGIRPLENFLAASLTKRLVSLKRDTYYRANSESGTKRKAAMDLLSYEEDFSLDEEHEAKIDSFDEVEFILDKLPVGLRADFLRMSNGVSLSPTRKASLFEAVRKINEER
jgi:DNA-directed RNA polymerase specialized sigma24 family protein